MSRVRPEECKRNIILMPSEAKLQIFCKKFEILALNSLLSSYIVHLGLQIWRSGVVWVPGPPPPDPLVELIRHMLVRESFNCLLSIYFIMGFR